MLASLTSMTFAAAVALTPIGESSYEGEIQSGWDILGKANGGYLLAIAAHAGLLASGRRDPVSITGHFLAPATAGPVIVDTAVLKEGGRFATVRCTVRGDAGRPLVAALGSYGELAPVEAPERVEGRPPELPPLEQCIKVEPTATFPPPFMANVDLRLHPADTPVGPEGSPGRPRVRGYFRWAGGEPLNTLGLVVAADAFPPTIFNADLPVAWTPTLELTTHVREAPPPDEWLRCSFNTRFITGGFLEEDGELWAESGRLIAQSRQLALLPRG